MRIREYRIPHRIFKEVMANFSAYIPKGAMVMVKDDRAYLHLADKTGYAVRVIHETFPETAYSFPIEYIDQVKPTQATAEEISALWKELENESIK